MALEHSFHVTVEGVESTLPVVIFEGNETVHGSSRFEATIESTDAASELSLLEPESILGQRAELSLGGCDPGRTIHGIVDSVEEVDSGYRLTIVPRMHLLSDRIDHRVFVDQDAIEIAKQVLSDRGLDVASRVVRKPAKRSQCVQAFEDDLSFVSRILAEEGTFWHVEHVDGKDTVAFTDHTSAYQPIPGDAEIVFSAGDEGGLLGKEAVFAASLSRSVAHGKVSLRDFDFERPLLEQGVSSGDGALERYEYPGGYSDPAVGRVLSEMRLSEAQGRSHVLSGSTTSRRLAPGQTFTLSGAPRDDMNGDWLILEVRHRGSDTGQGGPPSALDRRRYTADFVAVPAGIAYRPPRPKPPTLGGVQTATMTGAAGSEIHPDKHGRIKALLRWDRLRSKDETSSHWMRPLQPPTSGGFFLPRVGWEVLLGFEGISGDEPYEIGRLYNASAPPPEGLPGQKVRSAFGTQTTPGGGSANLLRMDDAAGNEGMLLNASRDCNERTENDKGTNVKGNDIHSVGADHADIVGVAQSVAVDGSQTYSVAASRDMTTVGNYMIETGTESVSVGGLRLFKVGGDYETKAGTLTRVVGALKGEVAIQEVNRHVTGVSTVLTGGSWTEIGGLSAATSVLGASTLVVAGPMSIKAKDYSLKTSALKEDYASRSVKAGAKRVEGFGAAAKYSVGGSMTISGAGGVHFKADSKITLKASGATITITPSAITVKGAFDSSEASVVTGKDDND